MIRFPFQNRSFLVIVVSALIIILLVISYNLLFIKTENEYSDDPCITFFKQHKPSFITLRNMILNERISLTALNIGEGSISYYDEENNINGELTLDSNGK